MFSFFSSAEDKEETNQQNFLEQKYGKQDGQAKVYIWSGGSAKGVGHVAIELTNQESKQTETKHSKYLSIWPTFPAIGPTAIIPLKAALADSLSQDIHMESSISKTTPGDPSDLCLSAQETEVAAADRILPDKVFTVRNLNTKNIESEIERLKEGVDNGSVLYQLLPAVNTLGFLNSLTNRLTYDTDQDFASIENTNKNKNSELLPEVYNCTTMVQHILKSGGMDELPKSSVWKPSSLVDILKDQPNVRELSEAKSFTMKCPQI